MFLFSQDGDRGYLEGLASRYADLFSTHYGDVLDHLEELRRHEWEEMSPRMRVLGGPGTPQTPPSASPGSLTLNNLTTSQSQPIYVPGKYSVRYQNGSLYFSENVTLLHRNISCHCVSYYVSERVIFPENNIRSVNMKNIYLWERTTEYYAWLYYLLVFVKGSRPDASN